MARVSGEAMAEVRGEDQGLGFRVRVSDIGEVSRGRIRERRVLGKWFGWDTSGGLRRVSTVLVSNVLGALYCLEIHGREIGRGNNGGGGFN